MYRILLFASLFLAATVSHAQFNPEVAYTQVSGKSSYIYLSNQDGSNAVRIFTASNKSITDVDIAPGGGKIAFSESGVLKLLSYSVSGSSIIVSSVVTLDSSGGEPNFSPDGSKIVYISQSSSRQLRLISSSGGVPKILVDSLGWAPAFMHTGDRIVQYKRNFSASSFEIEMLNLDLNDDVISSSVIFSTAGQPLAQGIEDIDTARTKDSILITANTPSGIRLVELDVNLNSIQDHAAGFRGHFSNDDSEIVYTSVARDFLYTLNISSSVVTKLNSRKSNFGFTDWKP